MQTLIQRTLLTLTASVLSFAQTPELIRGLSAMNSASLAAEGLPGAGVAPGSRFALFGRSLEADPAQVRANVIIDGATIEATVLSATSKRIDALLPLHAPLGSGKVVLDVNGTTLSAPIRIVERAFGIFAEPVPGSGGTRLRGTGLGRDNSPVGIEVIVGGQAVPAGGVTRYPSGYEDIDFSVPEGAASCATSVSVRANGRVSHSVLIPVAADCPAPDPGRQSNHGSVSLTRAQAAFEGFRQTADHGTGSFFRAPGGSPSLSPSGASAGSCTLQYFIEQDLADIPVEGLDAGPRLEVAGPKGVRDLELRSKGQYDRELGEVIEASFPGFPQQPGGLFLDAGEYTISGFGGADIGPFTAKINVPEPAVWTNRAVAEAIDRAQDLRIEWTGGDASQLVTFSGFAVAGARPLVGAAFSCIERGDKGFLTVPSQILSELPASGGRDGGQVIFAVTPERSAEFSAAGLDGPGALDYSQGLTSQAQFR